MKEQQGSIRKSSPTYSEKRKIRWDELQRDWEFHSQKRKIRILIFKKVKGIKEYVQGACMIANPKHIRKTLLADFLQSEGRKCKLVDESPEQLKQKIKSNSLFLCVQGCKYTPLYMILFFVT